MSRKAKHKNRLYRTRNGFVLQKKIKKVDRNYQSCNYMMVPEAGLEPAWILLRRILNPVRIPISPLGQKW